MTHFIQCIDFNSLRSQIQLKSCVKYPNDFRPIFVVAQLLGGIYKRTLSYFFSYCIQYQFLHTVGSDLCWHRGLDVWSSCSQLLPLLEAQYRILQNRWG